METSNPLRSPVVAWWDRLLQRIFPLPQPDRIEVNPEDPESWRSLDFIHEQVTAQIKQQWDIWNVVDGRLRLILGVVGIVFAAVLGFQRGPTHLTPVVVDLLFIAILCFVLAAVIAAIVYIPMNFSWPPEPGALREQYLLSDPRDTKLAVTDTIIEAYTENWKRIERKVNGFRIAFGLSAVAVVALAAALFFHIRGQVAP
jgi:hypothetical protein